MKKEKITLGLWVNPEFKQQFKEYCVRNKMTYEEFLENALEKAKRREKRNT